MKNFLVAAKGFFTSFLSQFFSENWRGGSLIKFFFVYNYTPPVFLKAMGSNLRSHLHHHETTLKIWELSKSISTLEIKLVEKKDAPFEFHFVKNGMEDSMKKMPRHGMRHWALLLNKVIVIFWRSMQTTSSLWKIASIKTTLPFN